MQKCLHPEDRTLFFERYRACLSGKPAPRGEFRFYRNGGALQWLELSFVWVKYLGRPSVQIVLRDVTQRKELEQEKAAVHLRLERMVETRTGELKRLNRELRGSPPCPGSSIM